MYVRDIMSSVPITIHHEDTLQFTRKCLNAWKTRHHPVVDADGQLLGVVTSRDLLRASTSPEPVKARSVMRRPVTTVAPDSYVDDEIRTILDEGDGCLAVVESNRVVGIVSRADLPK